MKLQGQEPKTGCSIAPIHIEAIPDHADADIPPPGWLNNNVVLN